MKHCFSFFIFFFLVHLSGVCQSISDSATMKCVYKLQYISNPDNLKRKSTDILHLLIGEKTNSFYSYITYAADSAFTEDIEGGKITPQQLLSDKSLQKKYKPGGFYSKYALYISKESDVIITTDEVGSVKFVYEETNEPMQWKVEEDTMKILDYTCQKAIGTFKGRNYIAWFTNEIPLDAGPYKFKGLPGLILKIADSQEHFVFECQSIERLVNKQPIVVDFKKYTRTTRKEFRKAFQVMFENPWQSLNSNPAVSIGGKDADKMKEMLSKPMPYNPIELE